MEIRYAMVNGIAFITLVGTSQHIAVNARFLRKLIGVSQYAVAGECPVSREEASELGFIIALEAAIAV